MKLPLRPPIAPMEAVPAAAIPEGWQYEPKWDGFRCLAFRDGDEVALQSKAERPLDRYFPEVVAELRSLRAPRFVLDGELIILSAAGESLFDLLLQRIHPAEARIRRLAAAYPARYVVFDLLVDEKGRDWSGKPLHERRQKLERFAAENFTGNLFLSPLVPSRDEALKLLAHSKSALDGIIAKKDAEYLPGSRDRVAKIKRYRSADCVVAGIRQNNGKLGSLLLGLYEGGLLHHVGHCTLSVREGEQFLKRLKPESPGFSGRKPGGVSRWSKGATTVWTPVRPTEVVEVRFDHVTGKRFRHGTKFVRRRPDKAPKQCGFSQLQVPRPLDVFKELENSG